MAVSSTASGAVSSIQRAPIQTSVVTTATTGGVGVYAYSSRGSGITVTGKRFIVTSSAVAYLYSPGNGISWGSRLAYNTGTVASYHSSLVLSGSDYSLTPDMYYMYGHVKHGTSASSPIEVNSYTLYDVVSTTNGVQSVGNTTGGKIENVTDIEFTTSNTVTFTPSFGVARSSGSTTWGEFMAWSLWVEIVA